LSQTHALRKVYILYRFNKISKKGGLTNGRQKKEKEKKEISHL
jgi:hypothetical protein